MSHNCIVTDGLQLILDAGDSESYSGSGSTWYDLSANNYDATLVNETSYNSADKGYFVFDGDNDYIDVNAILSYESFSVGAFFRTSYAGIKMIISKETTAGTPWTYRIWLSGGQIVADIAQGGTQQSLTSPLTSYNDGEWHHVMFTRDDNNWKLYVDGYEVNSRVDPFTGSIVDSQELWIGRSAFTGGSPTGSYPYAGDISVVMVYNKVLTGSEILTNYNCLLSRFAVFKVKVNKIFNNSGTMKIKKIIQM
jgi:hypothetical protein